MDTPSGTVTISLKDYNSLTKAIEENEKIEKMIDDCGYISINDENATVLNLNPSKAFKLLYYVKNKKDGHFPDFERCSTHLL